MGATEFILSYHGGEAEEQAIDLYDVAQALEGFQRSLAITTHLVLNGSVITQAPSLRGARILAHPPEAGSWKIVAAVSLVANGIYFAGTAPRDTPLGHLIASAYDYVISEALGFHVDYEKTLLQQYEEISKSDYDIPILTQDRFDSAIEKSENAIKKMHRPVIGEQTASSATIEAITNGKSFRFSGVVNENSYYHMIEYVEADVTSKFFGRVTSYNSNTYKGRLFVYDRLRAIPFELINPDLETLEIVADSLSDTIRNRKRYKAGAVTVEAYVVSSRTGRIKALHVVSIQCANKG